MPEPTPPDDRQMPAAPDNVPAPGTGNRPPLSFDSLALGKPEIQIEYRGQLYRLRVTRNGKLILNK